MRSFILTSLVIMTAFACKIRVTETNSIATASSDERMTKVSCFVKYFTNTDKPKDQWSTHYTDEKMELVDGRRGGDVLKKVTIATDLTTETMEGFKSLSTSPMFEGVYCKSENYDTLSEAAMKGLPYPSTYLEFLQQNHIDVLNLREQGQRPKKYFN